MTDPRIYYLSEGEQWGEMALSELLRNIEETNADTLEGDRINCVALAAAVENDGICQGAHSHGRYAVLNLGRYITPWEFVQTRLGPTSVTEYLRTSDDDEFVGNLYNGRVAIAEVEPGHFWTIVERDEAEGTLPEVERALYLMCALGFEEALERQRPGRPKQRTYRVTYTVDLLAPSNTLAADEARHIIGDAVRRGTTVVDPENRAPVTLNVIDI